MSGREQCWVLELQVGEVDCDDILCKGMVPRWMEHCAVTVCGLVEASCVMERSGYYAHVYCRLVCVL